MRELVIQAANGTLTSEDRGLIQEEIEQIKQGIDAIAKNTNFNNINLLCVDNITTAVNKPPIDIQFVSVNSGTNAILNGIS